MGPRKGNQPIPIYGDVDEGLDLVIPVRLCASLLGQSRLTFLNQWLPRQKSPSWVLVVPYSAPSVRLESDHARVPAGGGTWGSFTHQERGAAHEIGLGRCAESQQPARYRAYQNGL